MESIRPPKVELLWWEGCPSTDDATNLPGDNIPSSGLKDFEAINPDCISYAGRDNKQYRIMKDRDNEEVIASDDNFSALQRTLLLQFTLAEP